MIIDCHCHAGKGDGISGPVRNQGFFASYLTRASRAGIARTVLFPTFQADYTVANREVAAIVRSNPSRFYGFAFVHPLRDRGRVFLMVREAVRNLGFRGIKVHKHDGRITGEICDAARYFGVPILYDIMGDVAVLDWLANRYPDVTFIIPHLGSFGDDWRAQVALVRYLVRLPNIYTDTSGVRRFDILRLALNRAGPGKVLFGSDGPWLHPGLELAKIRALGLSECAGRLVLGGNFLRLIGSRETLCTMPPAPCLPLRTGRSASHL